MPAGRHRPLAVVLGLAAVFTALAVLAAVDGSRVLLHLDRPVSRWAVAHRSGGWTAFFRAVTHLGTGWVVVPGGLLLAGLAALRRLPAGVYVLAVTGLRPLAEWLVKSGVDRRRPHLAPLVAAGGSSFPSGHTMGAVGLWLLVPFVVALYVGDRTLRRLSWVAGAAVVVLVAASRVYLGVHWLTDVVGGILCAAVVLIGARLPFQRLVR